MLTLQWLSSRFAWVGLLYFLAVAALLSACDGEPMPDPTVTPTPTPEYLTEEIPPCAPVPGSLADPCEPGASSLSGGGLENAGYEPHGLRYFMEGSDVHVSHLVLRGAYLPGTVRCMDHGILFRNPPYTDLLWSNTIFVNCYADVRVSAYVLGSGPPTLTVMVYDYYYSFERENEYIEELRSWLERTLLEGGELLGPGGIEGREMMMFVGPTLDASAEALEVFTTWDVQRREDGTAIAVHPHRDTWRDDESYLSRLEMEMPAFTQAVAAANQERITEYGGRTGSDEGFPMLLTDANRLSQFFTDIGAYDHPDGPPLQPPPPCGLAVPSQAGNPGLMRDCQALLAAKDTLRGAGSLNWGTGTTIADWDGVTTSTDPSGITKLELSDEDLTGTIPPELGDLSELTHLDLSSNSLTGEIPRELGGLSNLESLKLTGNSLTGCIPTALKDVATNDLSTLNLFYCPPAPDAPAAGTPTQTGVPLIWTAVANTTRYRVEYRHRLSSEWTVDDDTLTGTTHTVDGLYCEGEYRFRVRAYGNGTTYAAAWSDPSDVASATTAECVFPDYSVTTYEFRVMEDAALDAVVGTVTATDASGSVLEYEIREGNEDGLFAIGESNGEVTVAADLSGKAGTTETLTVVARNAIGAWRSVPVEVAITETCDSGTAVPNPSSNAGLVADCNTLLGLKDALAGTATLNWSLYKPFQPKAGPPTPTSVD